MTSLPIKITWWFRVATAAEMHSYGRCVLVNCASKCRVLIDSSTIGLSKHVSSTSAVSLAKSFRWTTIRRQPSVCRNRGRKIPKVGNSHRAPPSLGNNPRSRLTLQSVPLLSHKTRTVDIVFLVYRESNIWINERRLRSFYVIYKNVRNS